MFKKTLIVIASLVISVTIASAQNNVASGALNNSAYQVCFTPGGNCTQMIVNAINAAKKSIDVQAYSFTSAPIIHALIEAEHRGVDVQVLLDKSNVTQRYNVTITLTNNNVPFLIDYKPKIAHNKVIIFDNAQILTGSFNFTKSAQISNAENAIIINNPQLAQYYLANFKRRQAQSVSLSEYLNTSSGAHKHHR